MPMKLKGESSSAPVKGGHNSRLDPCKEPKHYGKVSKVSRGRDCQYRFSPLPLSSLREGSQSTYQETVGDPSTSISNGPFHHQTAR